MAAFRLSRRAEADLIEIAKHTINRWGEDQAIRYLEDLETCCRRIAGNPSLGRTCDPSDPA